MTLRALGETATAASPMGDGLNVSRAMRWSLSFCDLNARGVMVGIVKTAEPQAKRQTDLHHPTGRNPATRFRSLGSSLARPRAESSPVVAGDRQLNRCPDTMAISQRQESPRSVALPQTTPSDGVYRQRVHEFAP